MKLYQKIARVLSQENTLQKGKDLALLEDLLPPVNKTPKQVKTVILVKSTKEKIEIATSYWHYDKSRWTDHRVVIKPSFVGEINIRITGKNENNVKEYLHGIFHEALMKEYVVFKKGWEVKDSSEIKSELDYVLD